MEINGNSNGELGSLVGELTKGMELTKQLKSQLAPGILGEPRELLVEGILSSYENALLLLNYVGPPANVPESPISVIRSPKSEDLNPGFNTGQDTTNFSRKRKTMSTWTEQVKVSSENELSDRYSWRKYGQKDILGAKYPRSYYRCTYRNLRGCFAKKQVQRNEEDPSIFDLTYKGKHSCMIPPHSKSAPTSPVKHEWNKNYNFHMTHQQHNVLRNFQRELSVEIPNLESHEAGFSLSNRETRSENRTFTPSILDHDVFFSHLPPPFIPSPASSASNYFTTSPCNLSYGVQYGQHCESDIRVATSGTISPIIGMDFLLEQLEFEPSFHFDNQVFFPSFSQPKE